MLFFFFFQAEDGIRDLTVTGVQTCALPIYVSSVSGVKAQPTAGAYCASKAAVIMFSKAVALECLRNNEPIRVNTVSPRSEERRVGKECRSRGSPYHVKKKRHDCAPGRRADP